MALAPAINLGLEALPGLLLCTRHYHKKNMLGPIRVRTQGTELPQLGPSRSAESILLADVGMQSHSIQS